MKSGPGAGFRSARAAGVGRVKGNCSFGCAAAAAPRLVFPECQSFGGKREQRRDKAIGWASSFSGTWLLGRPRRASETGLQRAQSPESIEGTGLSRS